MADETKSPKKLSEMSEKSGKKEKVARYDFSGGKQTINRKKDAIRLLDESFHNIGWVCAQMGIQRRSFKRWQQTDPEFDRACIEIWEGIIDGAEVHLQKNISNGKEASLIFFLKTRAKERGYIEKTEIVHSGGAQPVKFNLVEKTPEEIKHAKGSPGTGSKFEADGDTKGSGGQEAH